MSPLLIKISKDFATLWTTIDPIANVALFAGLTAALSRKERHLTALRGVIYATIILLAAGTIGEVVLDAIGIRMPSLKVAGGIILFLFRSASDRAARCDLCHHHPPGRRNDRRGRARRDRHPHALAQSRRRHHSVFVRCADALRENGCKDASAYAARGARSRGVPAGCAFHCGTRCDHGGDRVSR